MSLWPVIRDLFIRKAAEEVIEAVIEEVVETAQEALSKTKYNTAVQKGPILASTYKSNRTHALVHAWQFTKQNYTIGVPHILRSKYLYTYSQYGGHVIGGAIEIEKGSVALHENDFILRTELGDLEVRDSTSFNAEYTLVL